MYGVEGDTGEIPLAKSLTHRNKFERKQEDQFIHEAVDLGELRRLKVWHDNWGLGSSWFLDRIEVFTEANPEHVWVFPCDKWLSKGHDDKQARMKKRRRNKSTNNRMKTKEKERAGIRKRR